MLRSISAKILGFFATAMPSRCAAAPISVLLQCFTLGKAENGWNNV